MRRLKLSNEEIDAILAEHRITLQQPTIRGTNINQKVDCCLSISENAYKKMRALVDTSKEEVGWHFLAHKISKAYYEITDVIVFPQKTSAATVTTDDVKYTKWLIEWDDEIFSQIRGHGHSHVNMGVTPSATDIDYQNNMLQNLEDFYIFLIINKRDDIYAVIADAEENVVYDCKDITVELPYSVDFNNWAQEQLAIYVDKKDTAIDWKMEMDRYW